MLLVPMSRDQQPRRRRPGAARPSRDALQEVIDMAVLVAYAPGHASTGDIAERIGVRLRELGWDAEVAPAGEVHDVAPYVAVVVGSAVHRGRWLSSASDFVRRHGALLTRRPVWLFSDGAAPAALREAIRARDHRALSHACDVDAWAERIASEVGAA